MLDKNSSTQIEWSTVLKAFLLASVFIVVSIPSHARELPEREITATENDYALRDAVVASDLVEFERLLSLGAEPTEWLDDSPFGWVLCASTEVGKEGFLQALISHGVDVNHHQTDIGSAISTPLACAVRFRNLEATKQLIAEGADAAVALCRSCRVKTHPSVLSTAVMVRKYELAVFLLDKADYHDAEFESIVRILERGRVDEESKWNKYRLQLADLLREKGYEVTPWTRQRPSGQ